MYTRYSVNCYRRSRRNVLSASKQGIVALRVNYIPFSELFPVFIYTRVQQVLHRFVRKHFRPAQLCVSPRMCVYPSKHRSMRFLPSNKDVGFACEKSFTARKLFSVIVYTRNQQVLQSMSEAFSEVQRTFRQQIINPIHPALRAVILASLLCIYTLETSRCYNQCPKHFLRCSGRSGSGSYIQSILR